MLKGQVNQYVIFLYINCATNVVLNNLIGGEHDM